MVSSLNTYSDMITLSYKNESIDVSNIFAITINIGKLDFVPPVSILYTHLDEIYKGISIHS